MLMRMAWIVAGLALLAQDPSLKAGDPAPDFALKDQDARDVRLADLKGRWVLMAFFPKAMTPG
jgi:peroxiredoxin